jgi:hypothetical protein
MGLQPERLEEAMDAGLGDAGCGGQPTYPPMGAAILGPTVKRRGEELGAARVVDRARLARAQLVMPALDAPCRRAVGCPRGAGHNDVGAAHQRCWQRMRPGDRLQLRLLLRAQHERRLRSTHRHRGISIGKVHPDGIRHIC